MTDRSAHGPRAAGGSFQRGRGSRGRIPSPHELPLTWAAARPGTRFSRRTGGGHCPRVVSRVVHAPAPIPQGALEDVTGVSAERLGDRPAFVQQVR